MNRYEIVDAAIRTNAGKSTRAEDLGEYAAFYVDPVDTSAIESNTNQLIYGRRGSGKTLTVGALDTRIRARFPETKVISFAYTATAFRRSAEYESVKDKAHAFFHSFIEALTLDIFALADAILKKPRWLASLSLAGATQAAKRDKLGRLVLELLEAAGYGSDNPLPTSFTGARETRTTRRQDSGIGLGAGLSFGASSPVGASLRVGAGRASANSRNETETTAYRLTRYFNPSRVRELLLEIIDLLELNYIVIFLDEWMSLAECQVEFAERLRQCLFGDHRIGVKIAADQYQGQLNNAGQGYNFRGLEVDGDIFVAVDLDYPFRDSLQRNILFAEALYRRLRHFQPDMDQHFGPPPLVNPERFLATVFSTDRAFDELCAGAQGLCRDFHLLFQESAKQLKSGLSSSNRVDFEAVRRAIIELTAHTYGRAAKSIDSNALLFGVITPHIQSTGSRYFILESRPSDTSAVVNELLSKRVIHSIESSKLHPSIRGEYDCFEIAYGIFVDLMRAAEFSTGKEMDDTYDPNEVAMITATNKMKFLLDLTPLAASSGQARLMLCPSCEHEFSSAEKAYQARHICPHCYMDMPVE